MKRGVVKVLASGFEEWLLLWGRRIQRSRSCWQFRFCSLRNGESVLKFNNNYFKSLSSGFGIIRKHSYQIRIAFRKRMIPIAEFHLLECIQKTQLNYWNTKPNILCEQHYQRPMSSDATDSPIRGQVHFSIMQLGKWISVISGFRFLINNFTLNTPLKRPTLLVSGVPLPLAVFLLVDSYLSMFVLSIIPATVHIDIFHLQYVVWGFQATQYNIMSNKLKKSFQVKRK